MKAFVIALALASGLAPSLALAQDSCHHNRIKTTEISCAEGQTWDAQSQRCVLVDS